MTGAEACLNLFLTLSSIFNHLNCCLENFAKGERRKGGYLEASEEKQYLLAVNCNLSYEPFPKSSDKNEGVPHFDLVSCRC
jgi:hypothetical protein